MQQLIRQGDIALIRTEILPPTVAPRPQGRGRLTLGYGEVSGHHHVLEDAIWVVAEKTTQEDLRQFALGNKTIPVFVVVEEETQLVHQEHDTLIVQPGIWQVVRQREYTPGAIVSVRD
jgi:hypothetical protein